MSFRKLDMSDKAQHQRTSCHVGVGSGGGDVRKGSVFYLAPKFTDMIPAVERPCVLHICVVTSHLNMSPTTYDLPWRWLALRSLLWGNR